MAICGAVGSYHCRKRSIRQRQQVRVPTDDEKSLDPFDRTSRELGQAGMGKSLSVLAIAAVFSISG